MEKEERERERERERESKDNKLVEYQSPEMRTPSHQTSLLRFCSKNFRRLFFLHLSREKKGAAYERKREER